MRLSYRIGDVFRVVQQVRDDEWQCSSGQKNGIVSMTDFDVVRPVKPTGEFFALLMSGNPVFYSTIYRGLSQVWRKPFLSSLLATFEFQSGEWNCT
jgi:hypothetical protein